MQNNDASQRSGGEEEMKHWKASVEQKMALDFHVQFMDSMDVHRPLLEER